MDKAFSLRISFFYLGKVEGIVYTSNTLSLLCFKLLFINFSGKRC